MLEEAQVPVYGAEVNTEDSYDTELSRRLAPKALPADGVRQSSAEGSRSGSRKRLLADRMAGAAATAGGVGVAGASHGVVSTAAAAGACTLTAVPGSCSQACCTAAMAHNPHSAHLRQPLQQHPSSVQGQLAASPPNGYTQPRSRLRTNGMDSASTSSLQSIEAEFQRLHEQKQHQHPRQLEKVERHSTFGSPHEGLGPNLLAHADPHADNVASGCGGWGLSPGRLQAQALPTLLQQRQQQPHHHQQQQQQRQHRENQVVPDLRLAHGPQHQQHSCGSNDARSRDHGGTAASGGGAAARAGASVALPGDAVSAWLGGRPYTTAGLPSPMLQRKGSAAAAGVAAAGIAVPLSYRQRAVLAAQTQGSEAVPGDAVSLAAGPVGAHAATAAASVSAAQAAYSALISGPGFSYAAAEAQDGMPSGSYGISISLGGSSSSSSEADEDEDGLSRDDAGLHLRDEDFLLSGYDSSEDEEDEKDAGRGATGVQSAGGGPLQKQVCPPPMLPLKARLAALGGAADPEPSCGSSSGSSGRKPAAFTLAPTGEDSSDPNKGCASPAVMECNGETSGGARPVAVRSPAAAAAAAAAASVVFGAAGGVHGGGAAATPWRRRTAAAADPATSAAGAAAAATVCEPIPMSDVEPPSEGVQRMCSEASEAEAPAEARDMERGSSSGSGSEGEDNGMGDLMCSALGRQAIGGVGDAAGARGEEEWAEAREEWASDGGGAEDEVHEDGIGSEDEDMVAGEEGEGSGEPPDRSMSGGSQLSTSVGSGGAATAAPAAVADAAAGGARAGRMPPSFQLPPRVAGEASTAAMQVQPGFEALQGLAALMQPWLAQPQMQMQPQLAPLVVAAPALHLAAAPAPLAVQQLLGVPPAPVPLPLALGLAAGMGGAVGPPMPPLGPAVLQAAPASVATPSLAAALHSWLTSQQMQQHQQEFQPRTVAAAAVAAGGSSGTGTADGTGVRTAGAGISSAWLAPDAQLPPPAQQLHKHTAAAAAGAQGLGLNTALPYETQVPQTHYPQAAAALASHPVLLQAHYLAAAAGAQNAIPPYAAPPPAPAYEWTHGSVGQGHAAGPQPPLPLARVQVATAAATAAANAAARPQASRLLPPETYMGLVMEIIDSVRALPSQQATWQQREQTQQRQRQMQLVQHQAGQWQMQGSGQGGAGFGAEGLFLQQR